MAAWSTGGTRTRLEPRFTRSGMRIGTSRPTTSRAECWAGSEELEHIGVIALESDGENGPDYDLAAKIRLSLIKLSSVNRQRVDLTAQVAMTSGPDLSNLSEAELRAIELGDDQQLSELPPKDRYTEGHETRVDVGRRAGPRHPAIAFLQTGVHREARSMNYTVEGWR